MVSTKPTKVANDAGNGGGHGHISDDGNVGGNMVGGGGSPAAKRAEAADVQVTWEDLDMARAVVGERVPQAKRSVGMRKTAAGGMSQRV